MKIEDSVALGR